MTKNNITEVTSKVVDLLTTLTADERQRVIRASLVLLGDDVAEIASKAADPKALAFAGNASVPAAAAAKGEIGAFARPVNTWIAQNELTLAEIEQAFHIEDAVATVIADVPGGTKKEQALNSYVLTGLANFLSSGEAKFTDKAARELCNNAGCYDQANHSRYISDKGNEFTGSKEKGWTLTAPGLKRGAKLLKDLGAKDD